MSSPVLLCIDDRPQMLQVRKANLEPLGYSVLTATTAPTALAMLEEMAIDVVLVEYKLEGIDAEAVALHIKRRFPNQPIVLLSAYSETPERIFWLVDEYVVRSESPERLAQVIDEVTRSARKLPSCSDGVLKIRQAIA